MANDVLQDTSKAASIQNGLWDAYWNCNKLLGVAFLQTWGHPLDSKF